MTSNVRLQNLRNFTVQIRHPGTDAIVGTGIAVSTEGLVVTCAQVVKTALGVHPREAVDSEVGVYFPQAPEGAEKARWATVAACFPQHDDDMVLLQLTGGSAPLGPEQIAVLGSAEQSPRYPFRSYGYRRLHGNLPGHAHGTIRDFVRPPRALRFHSEPLELGSRQIGLGMSGAPLLDFKRNLVVGLVSEAGFPGLTGEYPDSVWLINAQVLAREPFSLPVRLQDLPRGAGPDPRTSLEPARAMVAADLGVAWNNAPEPPKEWAGRAELLQDLSLDFADPEHSVTGLIGAEGEGKSSLARRWVDDLLADAFSPQPDGVFWWSFHANPSVDEFFEAAFKYMTGGDAEPRRVPSATVRAQILGAMLSAGRFLFILDRLEVTQHQEGDQYGLFRSADLREFLAHFAGTEHESFCLLTSRVPVLDLMEYGSYYHRRVKRLDSADGRAILLSADLVGTDAMLHQVVTEWGSHSLTLRLLGAHLANWHMGNVEQIHEIPPPAAGESRQQHVRYVVRRALDQYHEHLTKAERSFLMLFSAFRTPVPVSAFERVFRADVGREAFNAPIVALDESVFGGMVRGLVARRILHYCRRTHQCTIHPLIHDYYQERLAAVDPAQVRTMHGLMKDYYLELGKAVPREPLLHDLSPLIEAVHHACSAGAYDEAYQIYFERIRQHKRSLLVSRLRAYSTNLALMREFFANGDTTQEPQVSRPQDKKLILDEMALCLTNLGRLTEALPFHERSIVLSLRANDWSSASSIYRSLADIHSQLGALDASAKASREALALALRTEDRGAQRNSLYRQAWAAHLYGDLKTAGLVFRQAERLEKELNSSVRFLYGLRSIKHACHLLRNGRTGYARRVTVANLEICKQNQWYNSLSLCHAVLGDLESDSGHHQVARAHYDEAVRIAQDLGTRDILTDVLLARGRWFARQMKNPADAFHDLYQALACAALCGCRIHEADVRTALAWAHLAAENPSAARAEAERALHLSIDMSYHWGQVDAKEVLGYQDP